MNWGELGGVWAIRGELGTGELGKLGFERLFFQGANC